MDPGEEDFDIRGIQRQKLPLGLRGYFKILLLHDTNSLVCFRNWKKESLNSVAVSTYKLNLQISPQNSLLNMLCYLDCYLSSYTE